MTQYGLICLLLLGSLAWGQAGNTTSAPAAQQPPSAATAPSAAGEQKEAEPKSAEASKVAPDAPVITISGLCENPPADKSAAANCKTVVTRAEFEGVIDAVQPSMPARFRRQFATRYATALVMSEKARQMGLDKGPRYEERMKLAKIQVLSQELNQALQEKASQISDADIEEYYKANAANFEEADMQKIFIPHKQEQPSKEKLTEAQEQKIHQDNEAEMKKAADALHTRAVAGEDFAKLQAEAFTTAGIKTKAPNASMSKVRRANLPPAHEAVMDLKAGEVSAIISDASGWYIYKMVSKNTLTLDQAKDEIRGTLHGQRMQDAMQEVQRESAPDLNNDYFAADESPAPGMMGMPMPPGGKPPVKPPANQSK